MKAALVAGLVGGLLASGAMAAVTTVAHYSFDDPSDVGYDTQELWPLVDGNPTWVPHSPDNRPAGGGAGYIAFDGATQYFATGNVTTPLTERTKNYGLELWVKASAAPDGQRVVFSFNPTPPAEGSGWDFANTLQLLYTNDSYSNVEGFVGTVSGVSYVPNSGVLPADDEWVHLALVVFDAGVALYVNGQQLGDVIPGLPNAPLNAFTLGQLPGGGQAYAGAIDELRLFTFESGAFRESDLSVPEPASLGLLGMGALGLAARRRRA